jgi:hypothetical protein
VKRIAMTADDSLCQLSKIGPPVNQQKFLSPFSLAALSRYISRAPLWRNRPPLPRSGRSSSRRDVES